VLGKVEIYLRALQRYLQPNREDQWRGVASADIGAALVGGHSVTSGTATLRTQMTERSINSGVRAEKPKDSGGSDLGDRSSNKGWGHVGGPGPP
jgi:hypothetical protein